MWKVGEKEPLGDAVGHDLLGAPLLTVLARGGDELVALGWGEVEGRSEDQRPAVGGHVFAAEHGGHSAPPNMNLAAGFVLHHLREPLHGELAIFQQLPRHGGEGFGFVVRFWFAVAHVCALC